MFKVNAIITMKFDKRNSTEYFRQKIDNEIKDIECVEKVLSKEDNDGYITMVVKKELWFDTFQDFIFNYEQTLRDYEKSIGCVDFKEATFEDGKLILNQYI